MNRTHAAGVALGAMAIASHALGGSETTRYSVTSLGSIPASSVCPCFFGEGLDEVGGASGMFFNTDGFRRTYYWDSHGMIDIGTLGGEDAVARGMGPDGSIVGYSDTAGNPQRAFYYKDGVMLDLGTLGGEHSVAHDANASRQIVGNASRPEPDHYHHAFRWTNGVMLDLGTFGGEFSSAEGVNAAGHVVGWAWNADRDQRAFLWTPQTGMIDLGDLGAGQAIGIDINDNAQVIASSLTPEGDWHTFLWHDGARLDLGTLPNAGEDTSIYGSPALVDTIAAAINNHGQVVGTAQPEPADGLPGPFIWQDGQIRNLNTMIDLSSGWVIRYAGSINDAGQIVATARFEGGGSHAVLLTPYCAADVADPRGVLDFSDVISFLTAFGAQGFDADIAEPIGVHDFSDVVAFLWLFAGGCPG